MTASTPTGRRLRWPPPRTGMLRRWLLLGLSLSLSLSLSLGGHVARASIHEVHGPSTGAKFTERMFADGHGPFGMGGRSTVEVNVTIAALDEDEVEDSLTVHRLADYFDFGIIVVAYTDDSDRMTEVDTLTLCARNFSDPDHGNRIGVLEGAFHVIDNSHPLTVTMTFHPLESGLQVVLMVPCWKQKRESFGYPVSTKEFTVYPMKDPLFAMEAIVTFRNPYGYLPALLYGLFPFSAILSLLYGFVDLCFLALINRHRENALGIQYVLFLVLVLATGESASWFFTYDMLNTTGTQVCCPYPGMLLLSTIMKIIAGMVSRVATTLICLGYGVVRPHISASELFVVVGLGVCYFISVGALEISHILNQSDGHAEPPAIWEFLVVATNFCFIGWIFTSLTLTRKNLAMFGQTAKLRMYDSLAHVLYAYVLVSFFLMGLEGAVYSGSLAMEWEHIWVIWASNRLLVFIILFIVTVTWRPKATSQLYAQMDQIPLHDSGTSSSSGDIEMMPRVPCALDELTPRRLQPVFGEKDSDPDNVIETKGEESEHEPDRPLGNVAMPS